MSFSFILCNKSESFLNWIVIGRKVDWIWQPGTTSLEVGPRSSKVLLKPNLHQKNVMVTVQWFVAIWSSRAFSTTPRKTVTSEKYTEQISEMRQKLQCLEQALVNRMGPILLHNVQVHIAQPTLQKLNELGYEVLPHSPYSPDLLPINYCFFKLLHTRTTFCRENASRTSRRPKMLSNLLNPKARIFMMQA